MANMSKSIRKICATLAFSITILSLAACSNDNEAEPTKKIVNPVESSSGLKSGPSWSQDTSRIRLDWYINAGWYAKSWDSKNTLFDRIVTQETGVEPNIIIPSSNGNEKLIAMASSGNLPELITIDNWNEMSGQLMKSGVFQPMNKLAEKYAPELLNIIPDSMQKWLAQPDGNWYAVTNDFTAPEKAQGDLVVENANGVIARRDIMSKLGIKPEDFLTQDGTIAALKKVKEAHIKQNGKEIIPFYFQWNDWVLARMWGIPWEDREGNWVNVNIHPKYLEIYKFLNRLWREGLLSKDNFTLWAGEKIQQGFCFAYLGNIDDISIPLAEIYRNDKLVYDPVGPIHALDNAKPVFDQAGTGWMSTWITNKSKYPDRAVRLIAFLSSDQGQMLTWYGVEGDTYNLVNGKVKYTSKYLKMNQEDPDMAKKVYGINNFWPLRQSQFNRNNIDVEALPQSEKNNINITNYFSRFAINTPETMGIGPEQQTPEAGIKMRIDEYWFQQTRNMVMAESPEEVESIYNEMLKQIELLNNSKLYEASNKKYQMQKQKMGKTSSYPYDTQK